MDNKTKKYILLCLGGVAMMVGSIVIMVLFGSPEPPRNEVFATVPLFVFGGWLIIYGAWGILGIVD